MLAEPISNHDNTPPATSRTESPPTALEMHAVARGPFTAHGRTFEASHMPSSTDYAQRVAAAAKLSKAAAG